MAIDPGHSIDNIIKKTDNRFEGVIGRYLYNEPADVNNLDHRMIFLERVFGKCLKVVLLILENNNEPAKPDHKFP